MNSIGRAISRSMLGIAAMGAAACSDKFLAVTNPNIIDAKTVDPTSGAATLAASAQQNYAAALGWMIMYSSYLSGETYVSETFPTRNEFGNRAITDLNGSLNVDVWQPISLAAASAKIVLDLTLPSPSTNLNIARAATFRGFAILQIATDFCSGTLSSGPELTTNQLLDSAIFWFGKGIDVGSANGTADGKDLANAARVGRARAQLQRGNKTAALADANAVPAGFAFNLKFFDDLTNRTRLSNRLWQFTFDRGSMSVAPAYSTGDPRVPFKGPADHKLQAQDPAVGPFFIQQKYPAYDSPIRLASRLEADYIAAEASDVAAQISLIAARRAANGQPAYTGGTDAASVLTELYNQRGFEFYLEGKRIADLRRQPAATSFVPVPGAPYIKPGYPANGSDACYPLPRAERDNNPNTRKP